MGQGGIFSGPTALGIACVGCGEAVSEGSQTAEPKLPTPQDEQPEPEAWWMKDIDNTPWWHETPTLLKPVQIQPWYLPEEKGPTTPEVIEAREKSQALRNGLIVTGVLAGLVLVAGALGGRIY